MAKLRATKTDDRLVLLKTNMDAGHGGAAGRFDRLQETAFATAFALKVAGRVLDVGAMRSIGAGLTVRDFAGGGLPPPLRTDTSSPGRGEDTKH